MSVLVMPGMSSMPLRNPIMVAADALHMIVNLRNRNTSLKQYPLLPHHHQAHLQLLLYPKRSAFTPLVSHT